MKKNIVQLECEELSVKQENVCYVWPLCFVLARDLCDYFLLSIWQLDYTKWWSQMQQFQQKYCSA